MKIKGAPQRAGRQVWTSGCGQREVGAVRGWGQGKGKSAGGVGRLGPSHQT